MRLKYIALSLVAILAFTGCSKKENITPEDTVSEISTVEVETTIESSIEDETEVISEVIEEDSIIADLPEFEPRSDTIGHLWIPSCDIKANIRYGSTMKAVSDMHVGEFECADEIGVGNYSVLGHSNEKIDYIFSDLEPNIVNGDCIYVLKNNYIYEFEVYDSFIVNPDEVWILKSTNQPIITIMCCTNSGTQRFVVRGTLKRSQLMEA